MMLHSSPNVVGENYFPRLFTTSAHLFSSSHRTFVRAQLPIVLLQKVTSVVYPVRTLMMCRDATT